MAIKTDLNTSPYFDDFDEEKNFHQVLFKPKQAVQARELTQLQTILQNQIERFGSNILVEGTIVNGGNFTDLTKLPYVKIRDNNILNQPVNILEYPVDAKVVGAVSGVEGIIIKTEAGLESQSPDLNTLYVKYTKSGEDANGNDIKTFLAGETLNFYIDDILVSELSVAVAPLSADANPIGVGYGVKCGDGIIFQKGFFIRFEDQTVIVSKYDNMPHNVSVGFETEEELVDSYADTSLLDNAAGFENYNAPGADRLKLTPKLVVRGTDEGKEDDSFFAIQEYQYGALIRRRTDTQFNSINKELKKRTYEESGNYSVGGLKVSIGDHPYETDKLAASIDAGVGYVGGERVEILSPLLVEIDKATDSASVTQQNVVVNYGSYVEMQDVYGNFSSNTIYAVTFRNAAQTATTTTGFSPTGTVVGTGYVRAVKKSGNIVRLYMLAVTAATGQNFSTARSVHRGTTAFGNIVFAGGVLKDSAYRPSIYPLGKSAIKEIGTDNADYVYYNSTTGSAAANGEIQISLSGTDVFPYGSGATLNSDQLSEIYVSVSANGQMKPVSSGSTDGSGASLTMNIGAMPASTAVDIMIPVKRSGVTPTGKELLTLYTRINCNGHTGGTYSLGVPDGYQLLKVYKGPNTTFGETGAGVTDITSSFTFVNGQNAQYYGHAMIKAKSGVTLNNTDRLLVKFKAFRKNTSGDYSQSFFCVNSYPIDDTSEVLPDNRIRTESIPSFTLNNGSSVDLRDVIDFRPYVANTAAYATTPAAATINTSGAPLTAIGFGSSPLFIAAPNEALEIDYSYYIGRKDRLIIDDVGNFTNIKGVSSESPSAPAQPKIGMTLAVINIPPYPSLPSTVANRSRKPQYGVSLTQENNRRYTMRDIGAIEKRVERLEYYTVLNAIEKEAEDMVVTDSSGLNRFKNGIFVDNFNNLMIADTSNEGFAASVDPSESVLAPSLNKYTIDMIPIAYSNIRNNNKDVLTLPYTNVKVASVQGWSVSRNCVSDFYNFSGKASVYPEYDNSYDETYAPDINLDVDLASAFVEYTQNLSKYVPLTNVSSTSKSSSSTATKTSSSTATNSAGTTTTTRTTNTTTTNTTTKTITDSLKVSLGETSVKAVGDFITNISFSPYMRSNVIKIRAVGLRPNTKFWFFFDGKYVGGRCAAGSMNGATSLKSAVRVGKWGRERVPAGETTNLHRFHWIQSDAKGELVVFFHIPANTFYTGDREFLIADWAYYPAIESSATSTASVTYRAFNYSVEKTGVNIATRTPDYGSTKTVSTSTRTSVSSSTTTTSVTVPAPEPTPEPTPEPATIARNWFNNRDTGVVRSDPISQTFMVEKNMTNDSVMFVNRLNLYFTAKDSQKGVTIQIRETDNGYPSTKVLPFGSIHLNASQVVTVGSNSASPNPCPVIFPVPVTLRAGVEYCFVIIPDGNSPNYRVAVSKSGLVNHITKKQIVADESTGTLFTATNNRAWTPHQDENIKYDLFKAQFAPATGFVNMVPNNYEYLNLVEGAGNFERGEVAFVRKTNAAGTISIVNGSSNVTGSGTSFTSYFSVGDYIAINIGTDKYEVARINEIVSNTSMVLSEVMKSTMSGRTYFKTVVGTVDSFIKAESRMNLKASSAKTGLVFAAGDILVGENSGAIGEIAEIRNIPVSYIQNHYYRSNFTNTNTKLGYARLYGPSGGQLNSGVINASFDSNDYFTIGNVTLISRSNEISNYSGARTFMTKMTLENTKSYLDSSPVFDYDISSMHVFEYIMNNDASDESKDVGTADARYISKVVELAESLDAEDLNVWLTAYKPQGTNIKVYAKFKSGEDSADIADIKWTELTLVDKTNFYSSTANLNDYRELQFTLPETGPNATYSETNGFAYTSPDGSINTSFKFFAIKIVLLSNSSNRIPKVKDMRALALT